MTDEEVIVYTQSECTDRHREKKFLRKKGVRFNERNVQENRVKSSPPRPIKKLKHEVAQTIKPEHHSVRFYLLRTTRYMSVDKLGVHPPWRRLPVR